MDDKIVLVTGGSRGIGREIVLSALRSKNQVIVCAREIELLKTLKNIDSDRVTIVQGDITKADVRQKLVEVVATFGRLDYLVNNAGFAKGVLLSEDTLQNIEEMVGLNVISLIDLTRLMLPFLKKSTSGRILNIASGFGVIPFPFMSTYVASKYAVVGFTKALNIELACCNVSASAYCPAKVLTGFDNEAFGPIAQKILTRIADNPRKMGDAIWNKRDSKKVVIYPTFFSFMAYFGKLVPDFIYDGGMKLVVKMFHKEK